MSKKSPVDSDNYYAYPAWFEGGNQSQPSTSSYNYPTLEYIWSNAVRLTRTTHSNLQDEIEYLEQGIGCNCSSLDYRISTVEEKIEHIGSYSVLVYKEGTTIYAKDPGGNVIAQGNAGEDDVEVIQAAIDGLPDGKGEVILAGGTYYVTQSINMRSYVSLTGYGVSTVLYVPDHTNPSYLPIIRMDGCSYASISNLKIDGNRDNQDSGIEDGIYINGGSHCRIVNLHICNICGYEGNGVFVYGVPSDFLIQGNIIEDIDDDGLDINGMVKSQIIGNSIHDCGDNGVDTEGSEYLTFSGNIIYKCSGNGIELEQEGTTPPLTKYCAVTGNIIYRCNDGIHVRSGAYNTISGNTIRDCPRYGIYFGKTDNGDIAKYNIVVGNIILSSGRQGIREDTDEADYNFFSGNYLKENAWDEEAVRGLHTGSYNNFWADDYHQAGVERKIRMYKNYKSYNISSHSIVIKERNTDRPYAIDVTSKKGDDLVLGVALEDINSNDVGFVILEGKTKLRVNGIVDIHRGDFLGTYTEPGVACKADSNDMAIAIALDEYTVDDSNGLIDVLVCTPRKAGESNFGSYSVIVYKDDTTIYARNMNGDIIAHGSAGADDVTVIQAAIDSIPSDGGKIILAKGVYRITQTLNLRSYISFTGYGSSTVLYVPDNTNPTYLPIITMNECVYTSISDIKIDGNRDNQESGREDGIYINGGSNCKIINTYICNIYGTEGNGIFVEGTPSYFLIQDNDIYNIQDDGIDLNDVVKSQVIGNNIHHCGGNGIDTDGAEYVTFSGNIIHNCNDGGLELEQENTDPPLTRYCTITGNIIYDCNDGIHIRSGGYNTITGNTIRNSGRYGIYLSKTDNGDKAEFNSIVGNIILSSGREGIYEDYGKADHNFFTGNYLQGNQWDEEAIWGVHSESYNNFWADDYHYAKVERKIRMYKNYQSQNISSYSIVIKERYTDRPYAIDVTTKRGDDLVLGVAIENISSNSAGFIMLEGKTKLRVNGSSDIHEGDFLGTYTEPGVACKAESGDMAVAIALEDYTADNSSGLIDVLVCTPRKICDGNFGPYSAIVYKEDSTIYAKDEYGRLIAQGSAGIDDGDVIQSALNSLQDGGKLFLKEALYNLSQTLNVKSNTLISGEGHSTILKGDQIVTNLIQNSDISNGNTNIIIKDLSLNGNRPDHSKTYQGGLINFRKVKGFVVENVYFEEARDHGIYLKDSEDGFVHNCFVDGNNDDSFAIGGLSNNIVLVACNAKNSMDSSFEIDDGPTNIFILGSIGDKTLCVKAHADQPRPKNVFFDGGKVERVRLYVDDPSTGVVEDVFISNSILGLVEIHHIKHFVIESCNIDRIYVSNEKIVEEDPSVYPTDGVIRDNYIHATGTAGYDGHGIVVRMIDNTDATDMRLLIDGNIFDCSERAILCRTPSVGGSLSGIIITNNLVKSPTSQSILIYAHEGNIEDLRIYSNWVPSISFSRSSGSLLNIFVEGNKVDSISYPSAGKDIIISRNIGVDKDAFKFTSQSIFLGTSDNYGSTRTITPGGGIISNLRVCKIRIGGTFATDEHVTIKIETTWKSGNTAYIEKTYTAPGTYYIDLGGQDGLDLWRDSDRCTSIRFYGKTDQSSTSAWADCDVAGSS